MANHVIILEIKENYDKYTKILGERKRLQVSPINLDKIKDNHPNVKMKIIPLRHETLSTNIDMVIESHKQNDKNFKFRLHIEEYKRPFFRYDSDGKTHKNNISTIPLHEQSVTTPHFHKYNEDGIEIAYKTNSLKQNTTQFEDINTCVMHFCDESNIRLNDNEYPKINQSPGVLQLQYPNENDPLANITF